MIASSCCPSTSSPLFHPPLRCGFLHCPSCPPDFDDGVSGVPQQPVQCHWPSLQFTTLPLPPCGFSGFGGVHWPVGDEFCDCGGGLHDGDEFEDGALLPPRLLHWPRAKLGFADLSAGLPKATRFPGSSKTTSTVSLVTQLLMLARLATKSSGYARRVICEAALVICMLRVRGLPRPLERAAARGTMLTAAQFMYISLLPILLNLGVSGGVI
jgi:hypothetical protein